MKKAFFSMAPLVLIVVAILISSASMASEAKLEEFPNTITESSTLEDQLRWKEEFNKWAEEKGKIKHLSGEKTKGETIQINGKDVKLPEDAYVKGFIVADDAIHNNTEQQEIDPNSHDLISEDHETHLEDHGSLSDNYNQKTLLPYYAIQRGESTIMISMNTGVVLNFIQSEKDIKPFDFLKQEITGYMKGVRVYE